MKLRFHTGWLLLALVLVVAGCATHRTNWNTRVGNFTYDQAVIELGPPDKQAKLTDGRVVADWITHYNTGGTVIFNQGFYYSPGGVGYIQTLPNDYVSRLRLIFSANNVLESWSRK
jgi:hypothetical protein